jgi:hypothetical protein
VLLGDFDHAAEVADELQEFAETRHQSGAALSQALTLRGMLSLYRGDLQTAKNLLVEAVGELRRLGSANWGSDTVRHVVDVCLAAGDTRDAAHWAQQLIDLSGHTLDARDRAHGYTFLARAALHQAHLQEAVTAASEALAVCVEADDTFSLAGVLATAAQIAWADSDASSAVLLHAGAETIRTTIGFVHPAPRTRELEDQLVELRTTLGPDTFNAAWKTGSTLGKEDLVSLATRITTI